jgi:hypothetical protein
MKVGLLTEEQKDLLVGQLYFEDTYYNPTQDGDGNWFISTIEMEKSDIQWVKQLPLIDYVEPSPIN